MQPKTLPRSPKKTINLQSIQFWIHCKHFPSAETRPPSISECCNASEDAWRPPKGLISCNPDSWLRKHQKPFKKTINLQLIAINCNQLQSINCNQLIATNCNQLQSIDCNQLQSIAINSIPSILITPSKGRFLPGTIQCNTILLIQISHI